MVDKFYLAITPSTTFIFYWKSLSDGLVACHVAPKPLKLEAESLYAYHPAASLSVNINLPDHSLPHNFYYCIASGGYTPRTERQYL